MKATRTHQWTSLLLSGALVAGMMITPSLAAGGAELEFQYPSDVKAEDVTITVHEGVPADSGEDAVKALPEVKKNAEGELSGQRARHIQLLGPGRWLLQCLQDLQRNAEGPGRRLSEAGGGDGGRWPIQL